MAETEEEIKKPEDNLGDTQGLQTYYESERRKINLDIKNLSSIFKNPKDVFMSQHEYYMIRQQLVGRKFELMQLITTTNRKKIIEKKNVFDQYKFGIKKSPTNSAVGIQLKNEEEREVYIGYDMKETDFLFKIIDNHYNFIVDSLTSIDRMIFSFEPLIQYLKIANTL